MMAVMSMLTTTRAVIATLGGTASVEALLGVKRSAVSNWRVTNKFPARTFLAIQARLKSAGATADPCLWAFQIDRAA